MNPFAHLLELVAGALDRLEAEGALPSGLDRARVTLEPPREAAHGDAATNAAMVLAKAAGRKPLDLARDVAAQLEGAPEVAGVAVAPPGFVNLTMTPPSGSATSARSCWRGRLRAERRRRGGQVNVEYTSANPTGPLHVGHARGTVFGDALANVLAFAGYEVTREYYVNDGGAQIETLARSIHHRYREVLGEDAGPLRRAATRARTSSRRRGIAERKAPAGQGARRRSGWTTSDASAPRP
jgi:arginyl-tRNA synthetase